MIKTHTNKRLPSLRAVHVFVISAQLGSFTAASRKLNVTQGAVSRLIQDLEEQLSVKLFNRSGPNLSLTDAGREFALTTGRAIELIEEAVETIHAKQEKSYINLSMLPSVATNWFAPRLGRFVNEYPDIDVRICASRRLVDFHAEDIDAAIRYGEGDWPGYHAELLATEMIFPVCTPAYAKKLKLLKPSDLSRATLLHADLSDNWELWFRKAGLINQEIPDGPKLGDEAAIRQAVCDSHGVSLGRSVLIEDDLQSGRLIAPFPIKLNASFSYWLVTLKGRQRSESIDKISRWIKKEFLILK